MALEHPQIMTVEEYFHLEEADTENRYEYIDGHVYMMAGGTFDHSTISGNIYSLLWASFAENRAVFTILISKYKFLKNATFIPILPSHAIHATEGQAIFSNLHE